MIVNWMTSHKFGWKVACCGNCNEPLFRMRQDTTNTPGYYCCICQRTSKFVNEDPDPEPITILTTPKTLPRLRAK